MTTPSPAPAPNTNCLTRRELVCFAVGGTPNNLGIEGIKSLVVPVYNILLGVNPALLGTVFMIARIYDAITDPLMGSLSDNTRTRWGRRRPYIALGGILCAICFPLIWWVPAGSTPNFALGYLFFACIAFYTAMTIFSVPYVTLSLEITPDSKERSRVQALRMMFGSLSGLLVSWTLHLAQGPMFATPMEGMRVVSLGMGAIFLIGGLTVAFGTRERYQKVAQQQARQPMWASLKTAVKHKQFRILLGLTLLIVLGTQTFNALMFHANTYYVFGGNLKAAAALTGIVGTTSLLTSWIMVPGVAWMAGRLGKIRALRICMAVGTVGGVVEFFLLDPRWPYAQVIFPALSIPAVSGFWVIVNSMKGDVCDLDEWENGVRREGVFAAVSNWCSKFAAALTFALSGGLLVLIGFDQKLGGLQSPETLFALRVAPTLMPCVAYLICLLLLRHYELGTERMKEIRADLEMRRGRTE